MISNISELELFTGNISKDYQLPRNVIYIVTLFSIKSSDQNLLITKTNIKSQTHSKFDYIVQFAFELHILECWGLMDSGELEFS